MTRDIRLRRWVHSVGAVAALGVQALLWAASYGFAPRRLMGDEGRYLREALLVWQGRAPAPDFIWPPLQKWFLAPLVGPLDGSIWLAQLVQTLLLVLAAWLLRGIWQRMDPRPLAADMAFWLLLASPAVMAFGFFLWPEPLHLVLLLGAVWLLTCHGRAVPAALLAGAAVALAMLTKSLLSGFWPLFVLLLLRWPLRRSHWRAVAAFVVALLVVVGPFVWRGWQATGKPLVADSSVYNLYVGLNDDWRSDYIEDHGGIYMQQYVAAGATAAERNAAFDRRVEATIAAHGGLVGTVAERFQIQYFRLFNAKRTVLSMLPGPACAGYLGAYALPAHWVTGVQWLTRAPYLLVLALAAFGLALWRRLDALFVFVLMFFGYQLALFLGLHVKARFLLPMLPFLTGFAASALRSCLPALAGAPAAPLPPLSSARWRLLPAVALAALLLFLACAGPWLDASCARIG